MPVAAAVQDESDDGHIEDNGDEGWCEWRATSAPSMVGHLLLIVDTNLLLVQVSLVRREGHTLNIAMQVRIIMIYPHSSLSSLLF